MKSLFGLDSKTYSLDERAWQSHTLLTNNGRQRMSGGNGATNWSGPVAIQVLDASHLKARLTDWWPCVTLIEFPLNQEGLITVDGTGPPAHTISQAQALMTNLPNGTVTVSGVSEYPFSFTVNFAAAWPSPTGGIQTARSRTARTRKRRS